MEKQFLKSIGQKIKEKRCNQKLTQEVLAEKIGVHPTYIGKIEAGKSNISVSLLFKISRALSVNLHDFFEFER